MFDLCEREENISKDYQVIKDNLDMGAEILDLKFMRLCFVMLFFDAATAGNKGPVLEVVSIYNDDFTTPNSREPYFIEVHRCVDHDSVDCFLPREFAIPKHYKTIKIVVPDLNKRTKFFRYVVYDHTSCKCGDANARKLNGRMQEVNETVFKQEYKGNPVNLRNKCEFCDKPQPRYRRHSDFKGLHPQSRYYIQHQCLPGCLHKTEVTTRTVMVQGGFLKHRTFSSDKNCTAYAPSHELPSKGNFTTGDMHQSSPTPQNFFGSKKSSSDKESKDDLIIFVGSARLLLAALALFFVLLMVLMFDFGLCRNKKGFFYALCSCSGCNNAEDFSNNYKQSRVNEVTVQMKSDLATRKNNS